MTARYREIAGALQERIATGEFDVGHLLPTEAELCEQFRASRFTIREALRRLDDAGLVARRQGSGTRVVSRAPFPRYVASLRNEADVLRYTAQTFLVPITGWGPASPKLRKELALNDDERWLALRAVRHLAGEGPAIGAATIAVLAELEPALASIDLSRPGALFAQLVEAGNLRLHRIEQEIYATSLSPTDARRLGTVRGSPALGVVRRFDAEGTGCFEVARTLHPADQFRFQLELSQSLTGKAASK
jgi:DNA-binding GntR family transcriptional regulator